MKPPLSVRDFASRIGIPAEQLYAVAENIKSHYRYWTKWNASRSKSRHMRVPDDDLMEIQRRINSRILVPLGVSPIAYGGVRGQSAGTNASQHLNQPFVVSLDAKDYFGNIRYKAVYNALRHHYGLGRDVTSLITRLVTLDDELPQGSPTSMTMANLVTSKPFDSPLFREAQFRGLRVTRFVDDVSLSGLNPQALINLTGQLLSQMGLSMYRRKTKFQEKPKFKIRPRSRPQEVTGLIVNAQHGPSVSRRWRDQVRMAISQLNGAPDALAREKALNSIRGRIAYVGQFNPGSARRLQRYIQRFNG